MAGKDWRPPAEIELLDDEALALVDELIRALANPDSPSQIPLDPQDLRSFDPYEEANLGLLKAAWQAAESK